jgi:uncharacterized protein
MQNIINWFEIATTDFERALSFYGTVMDMKLEKWPMGDHQMAFFPMEKDSPSVSGAIVMGEGYTPSADGTKVYLNCGDDLQPFLDRVEPAGGKVMMPKTQISPEHGFMALFMDTEGNALAMHSRS